ncbi:hypothetical protein OROHE_004983 [Orobanche hederae]
MGAKENTEQPPQDTTSDSIEALLEARTAKPSSSLKPKAGGGRCPNCFGAPFAFTNYCLRFTLLGCFRGSQRQAARYGDIDDVKSIASAGVSLDSKNSEGRTALHMASANGHHDIVDYLIQSGVDVNASNTEKNTPLHWACLNGHIEVVKYLVLAGAGLSLLNSHERTPIDEAISSRKMDVIDAINEATAQAELAGTRVS